MKRRILNSRRGAVMIIFSVLLITLFGFTALGIEAGRFYLVRSELSKAVDAAAMAGVKNISNPFVTVTTLADEVGHENFPAGQLGTPASGDGSVSFVITMLGNDKVQVVGRVSTIAFLTRLFGIERVATASSGVAQKKEVEIMMVLDKSGSMSGTPFADLKTAATSFLSFFTTTQDKDKMGLISFATGVTVNYQLSTNFVSPMTSQINSMSVGSGKGQFTNAEDAIDRSDDQAAGGFTDQSAVPGDQRIQQFLVFFTDGNPNAFRDTFTYNNTAYDAVAYTEGTNGACTGYTCGSDIRDTTYGYGYYGYLCNPTTGNALAGNIPVLPTGDGKTQATTSCTLSGTRYLNTKWRVFTEYPVSGYGSQSCRIPYSSLKPTWFQNVARQKAINHAQELKNRYVKIYTIGLGDDNQINRSFLHQIASGSQFEYYTPNSSELQAIFSLIAKEIKLRLIQ